MPSPPAVMPSASQRSSMESFLDEYQTVRLMMSLGGLALMAGLMLIGGWDSRVAPVGFVLLLVGINAAWSRMREIRSPRMMLALDLTVFGWVMVLIADIPVITTASLAFLTLLTVLFSTGRWTAVFLTYLVTWYGISFFIGAGVTAETVAYFPAVLFTVAGIAMVMLRVKGWLGRLDANRSQMIGTVSHELRNNLTGMIGMTELVGSQDLDPEEVRELVQLAHMQAVDAAEIVEDLLTASRLESAGLSVNMAPVDVNREVLTTVNRFEGGGMTISLDLGPNLPAADGDALRIRQILRNLLSNANRYGGPSVTVRTVAEESRLRVVVSDDGEGVPAEDEGTIFLPYRRSVMSRRDASSVGLGLWICRHLAHAMGGTIEYSRAGGITRFVFTLGLHSGDSSIRPSSPGEVGEIAPESTSWLGGLIGRSPVDAKSSAIVAGS